MSRFNTSSTSSMAMRLKGRETTNLAGGKAYRQEAKQELVSFLLTNLCSDQFYRSAEDGMVRLRELIDAIEDKQFIARAAIYARTQFGMRSITHVVAAELADRVKGTEWAKFAYDRMVYRADDILEILAYWKGHMGDKTLPKSLIKGLRKAIERQTPYSLAKYKGEGKGMKMVDAFNLLHPKPRNAEQAETFKKLMTGKLTCTDANETWESVSSEGADEDETSGKRFANEAEKWQYIVDLWVNEDGTVKNYFAALRNVRNVIKSNVDAPHMERFLKALTNKEAIKKSLIFPFRFITAIKAVAGEDGKISRAVSNAMQEALELSVSNVPKFEGATLVVLDTSGSMRSGRVGKDQSAAEVGALFGAALYKANDADFMIFDTTAKMVTLNPRDSILSLTKAIPFNGGGTDLSCAFRLMAKPYDRIIILSDQQNWVGDVWGNNLDKVKAAMKDYCHRTGSTPMIFSFDLTGHGTSQFIGSKLVEIAGFSDKAFTMMASLEKDKGALIKTIDAVELGSPAVAYRSNQV